MLKNSAQKYVFFVILPNPNSCKNNFGILIVRFLSKFIKKVSEMGLKILFFNTFVEFEEIKFNIMRSIFLTLIATFLAFNTFSQSIESVDLGPLQNLPDETSYQQAIGYDSDAYYFIRSDHKIGLNRNRVWLESVSALTNQIEQSNEIILPSVSGVQTEYETMFYKKNKFILFSSARDKNLNQIILYVSYLKPDGSVKNKPKKVAYVPLSNAPDDGFDIFLSDDEKNIIIESHKTMKKYNNEKFNLLVLDFDLKELFKGGIVLDSKYNNRDVEILQKVYNDSKFIFFAKAEVVSRRKSSRGKDYTYVVFVYNTTNKSIHEFEVKMPKFKVADAKFTIDNDGNIVVGGFVRGRSVRFANEKQGMFFKRYNPNTLKNIPDLDLKSFYLKFPRTFIPEIQKEEYGETKDIQYAYRVKSVEALANGAYIILAEQQWVDGRVVVEAGNKSETGIEYYHYNNIMAGGVNKKGKFEWIKLYPKAQNTTNDHGYYSSYKVIKVQNKLKLLYNDHEKNLHTGNLKKIKEFKNNVRTKPSGKAGVYTIYMDGSYERDPLFKVEDNNFVFIPHTLGKNSVEWGVALYSKKGVKFASFTVE